MKNQQSFLTRICRQFESASIRVHPRPIVFRTLCLCVSVAILVASGCSRFRNAPTSSGPQRYVVISPIYNEIIWALGAQDEVVGVDQSTTYPPDVKNIQSVGDH